MEFYDMSIEREFIQLEKASEITSLIENYMLS